MVIFELLIDGNTSIVFNSDSEIINATLIDVSGRRIWNENISISNALTDMQLMSEGIPTGIYIFNISNESVNQSLRIFIQQ